MTPIHQRLFRTEVALLLAPKSLFVICAWGLTILGPAAVQAEDWPQFRGPNCTGVSRSTDPLPAEFSFTQNVVWSTELGDGISSPIVAGGRVFSTAMAESDRLDVICHDAATGEQLWRNEVPIEEPPAIAGPNSYASSTPATDGERVYVYVTTVGLLAFDAADGKRLWQLPVEQPRHIFGWGAGGSPIAFDGMVFFNQDDDLNSFLIGVDAKTGELRWRTDRPEMLAGYAVPVICEFDGRHDLVVAGTGRMKGYNPHTGQEIWTCNSLLRNAMTTPVVHDGVIYFAQQSFGESDNVLSKALLQWKDTDQDGKLTREEVPEPFWKKFDRGDANGDGYLVDGEIDAAFQSPTNMVGGGFIIQAIRGGGIGDVTETHLLWSLDDNRGASDYSSPLMVNGRLFLVKRGGITNVVDMETGESLRKQKRLGNIGQYYASPVFGDDKIYFTGENGFIVVLANQSQQKVLAKNDMGESCLATPAIADGRIYIRTRNKLFCVAKPG
jgi:outer membrane protein assembly factor BamB